MTAWTLQAERHVARAGAAAALVVADRGEEVDLGAEPRELDRGDARAPPAASSQNSVASAISPRSGSRGDAGELDPLDVADDGDAHG